MLLEPGCAAVNPFKGVHELPLNIVGMYCMGIQQSSARVCSGGVTLSAERGFHLLRLLHLLRLWHHRV